MDTTRIHRASLDDLADLAPLFGGYRIFYGRPADSAAEYRFLHERLTTRDSVIFVFRDGGTATGFAQLFMTYSSVHLGPSLLLEDIFVDPPARGRGVAGALLARCKTHAQHLRAVGMFLETAHTNVTAQRVYERAGWQPESVFRKYNCSLEPAMP